MIVHRRKRQPYMVQAPMTSLIDVVFLLLIYFLLTTNFMIEEGISVKLPEAAASRPQTEAEITLSVDAEGHAYLGREQLPLDALFERLKTMLHGRPERPVILKADKSVVLDKAVRVMDVAKAAGAARLVLATEKELP